MKKEMKKEMRLIDANALLEKGYWHGKHPDWENPFAEGVDAVDTIDIENATTVDAVEVVRCKDCKWYNRNEDIMPQSGSCEFHEMVKMDWDFCSRAKMDGGDEDV